MQSAKVVVLVAAINIRRHVMLISGIKIKVGIFLFLKLFTFYQLLSYSGRSSPPVM